MDCSNRNKFCYVCGLFTARHYIRNITQSVINGFESYFVMAYVPNLWYAPEVVCEYCYRGLVGWVHTSKRHRLKYVHPITWLPRTEHAVECCYFCLSICNAHGVQYKTRETIKYANVESVIPSRIRSEECPRAPGEDAPDMESYDMENLSSIESVAYHSSCSSEFVLPSKLKEKLPNLVTQSKFNDLVRETKMSRKSAELHASRLKEWNLVASDFRITSDRKRTNNGPFDEVFSLYEDCEKTLGYCNDIDALFRIFDYSHDPNEWRLFIESSATSLKAVLLHIGNKYPSIPIAYATNMQENYENMKCILELINE